MSNQACQRAHTHACARGQARMYACMHARSRHHHVLVLVLVFDVRFLRVSRLPLCTLFSRPFLHALVCMLCVCALSVGTRVPDNAALTTQRCAMPHNATHAHTCDTACSSCSSTMYCTSACGCSSGAKLADVLNSIAASCAAQVRQLYAIS